MQKERRAQGSAVHSVWFPALSPTLSLWQFSHIQTVIPVRRNSSAGDQEVVNQIIFLGWIFHSQLLSSLRGRSSRLDKVITGWLSGEEMLMSPDKACRLLVWWARLWEDGLITFHLTVINWLLELEEERSLVMIFGTSFETATSRGRGIREITLRLNCDKVQLFSAALSSELWGCSGEWEIN